MHLYGNKIFFIDEFIVHDNIVLSFVNFLSNEIKVLIEVNHLIVLLLDFWDDLIKKWVLFFFCFDEMRRVCLYESRQLIRSVNFMFLIEFENGLNIQLWTVNVNWLQSFRLSVLFLGRIDFIIRNILVYYKNCIFGYFRWCLSINVLVNVFLLSSN